MTIAKTYAGNLAASFREEDTFLDSLLEREPKARWTPRQIGDLRVVPLASEGETKREDPGYSRENWNALQVDMQKHYALPSVFHW